MPIAFEGIARQNGSMADTKPGRSHAAGNEEVVSLNVTALPGAAADKT